MGGFTLVAGTQGLAAYLREYWNLPSPEKESIKPKQKRVKKHCIRVHLLDSNHSYHFKVENHNQVDFKRISEENPDSLAILVVWERAKNIKNGALMLHDNFVIACSKHNRQLPDYNRNQLIRLLGERVTVVWGFPNIVLEMNNDVCVLPDFRTQNKHRIKIVYSHQFKGLYEQVNQFIAKVMPKKETPKEEKPNEEMVYGTAPLYSGKMLQGDDGNTYVMVPKVPDDEFYQVNFFYRDPVSKKFRGTFRQCNFN